MSCHFFFLLATSYALMFGEKQGTLRQLTKEGEVELPSGWTRALGKLDGANGFRSPSGKWQSINPLENGSISEQALAQAQSSRKLVVTGLVNDRYQIMGEYELMEGEVVNGRAVWQKQGGDQERLLYAAGTELGGWVVSTKEHMHASSHIYFMKLPSAAFTPDRKLSSEVWEVLDGRQFAANPEVMLEVWEVHDVGCFTDERKKSVWERPEGDGLVTVVTQQISGSLTPAKCAATCWSKSFKYMGLQNGNDCWCGKAYNSEAEVGQERCSAACLGDKKSICGGWGVNSVHLINFPDAIFGKRIGKSMQQLPANIGKVSGLQV
jgi:hypothetical protein